MRPWQHQILELEGILKIRSPVPLPIQECIFSSQKKKNLPTTISMGFIVKYLFPDEAHHFNSKQKSVVYYIQSKSTSLTSTNMLQILFSTKAP